MKYKIVIMLVIVLFVFGFLWLGSVEEEGIGEVEVFEEVLIPEEVSKELVLYFVGDVMLSRGVAKKMEKFDDWAWPFRKVGEFLSKADLTFGNLEGPLSDKGEDVGNKYSFRVDPRALEGLELAGFDVMSIANNHILDWGVLAREDTIERLEGVGIKPVGEGVVLVDDVSIGFSAFTYPLPKSVLLPVADLNIVSMHLGVEYERFSGSEQEEFAKMVIDQGADLVVGHHPHVRQEIGKYKGKYIIYSLGNFVFDQSWSEETMKGWLGKVVVKDGEIVSVDPIEVQINQDFQPFVPLYYSVDKDNSLGSYYPDDLVSVRDIKIRKVVYSDLMEMLDSRSDLKLISGFRSFDYQKGLFESGNPLYVAPPGHSEHQLGTTIDFGIGDSFIDLTEKFSETEVGKWLAREAFKYGFVMSYPEGNDQYGFEPWHFRWFGKDRAREMVGSGY
jgi:poly-gamma-glutamate synthesis protein (capsule biosynthesis protein)